jgi:DNA-binding transcriptional MocR family regulator
MAALAGHRVVAGSRIDNYWLHTLTNAAQIPHVAKMEHVENVIDELGCSTAEIMDAQAELDRRGYLLHRAQGDAEWTFGLIEVLKQTAARNRSIGRPAALVPRNSWSNRTQSQNLIGAEF